MKICFDMDGTIADLYGVDGWLDMLINNDATPYEIAKPLVNLSLLARMLNRLQKNGYEICIISWLSKNSNEYYDSLVTKAKMTWLKNHMPSVQWNEINIVAYGTPKYLLGNGILFDDEERNREVWKGIAYDEKNIIRELKALL